MKRVILGTAMWMVASFVWASGTWQVMAETPVSVVAIELSSLQRSAERVSFRERHTMRDGQMDPMTQRPVREVLVKRIVDCAKRRIATLSRAVFSDGDALIDYQAVRERQAEWQRMAKDDPVFKLVCGLS